MGEGIPVLWHHRGQRTVLYDANPCGVGRSGECCFLLERAGQNSETGQAYTEDSSDNG